MLCLVHRSLPALVLLLIAAPVFAQRDRDTYTGAGQTTEIAGEVRSTETSTYAPGIQVRLERFSGGVIDQMPTDTRGRFRFINLQRGYYKIIINTPGFRPAQQDADLQVVFRAYLVFDLVADKSKGAGGVGDLTDVIDARVPPDARAEFVRGRDALSKKSARDAIAHFQKALSIYPEFFAAQLLFATALMDLREWQKAETAILRALQIESDNPTAVIALGEVYWREKRYDEAEKTLLAGLKLEEKNWHGHFTLGRLYWDKGEVMKAGPSIGRTLQLKPDFAEAHLLAGNILLRLNQPQRAQSEYEEYLRLSPKGEYAGEARNLLRRLQNIPPETKQ
jgi:tetratricopeptide (TPR) repeat protein